MVTLVAGAVAVGIVSVCAIPFGCFISRKLKKKVIIPPEVLIETEIEDTTNVDSESNPIEVADEAEYQIEEIWSRPNSDRVPRVEIRVLVSNGSEVVSQGYITASGASSSENGLPARAIEARRLSSQNFAAGPAADRRNEAGSSSLPMAGKGCENSTQESQGSDTTRLEITISGAFCKSVAQFGEFRESVPGTSTPKSKSSSTDESEEPEVQRSSFFWRRASSGRNGAAKVFRTTRDIVVTNGEVASGGELRQRRNFEPRNATGEAKAAEGKCSRNESRDNEVAAGVSSRKNTGSNCDRGRWGLPSRFFESFRETTSFATL